MSTYIPFTPASDTPFIFQPVLDGTNYTGQVTWNLYGQRYYLNIYTLSNTLIVAIAMVSGVNLVSGYFSSTLVFDDANQQFVVTP